jgi:hypothetical protein
MDEVVHAVGFVPPVNVGGVPVGDRLLAHTAEVRGHWGVTQKATGGAREAAAASVAVAARVEMHGEHFRALGF